MYEAIRQPGEVVGKRVFCFPSAIAQSHLTRLILIAQELQKQGVEIAFAYPEKHPLLKQLNCPVFWVPDVVITDFSSNVFAAYTPVLVEQCVQAELEAIQHFQPDAIIGDFRLTAGISTKLAKIPYISVVNGYMTNYFDPVEVMIPQATRPMEHKIASAAAKAIQRKQKYDLASPFRTVARQHGLKTLQSLYEFLTGDLTLVADLPEFCSLDNLPDSVRYIAPLIWEGLSENVPPYLTNLDPQKTMIYVTTGNTGKRQLIELAIAAFRDDPAFEVVVTTGAFIDPRDFPQAPNIHLESFIPGSAILQQAKAIIHCGGNGTVYQSLKQGVPSLVIPFNNDQLINAWLIKKHQVGIPISVSGLTGSQLKLTLKSLLQNIIIQQNVQSFKALLNNADGAKSAAKSITTFLSAK
jgi:UDP:flavonoid glycosyltransferase YjiC (YdhE family)